MTLKFDYKESWRLADRLIAVWIGCRNVFVYPPNKDFLKLNKAKIICLFNKIIYFFFKIFQFEI